MRDSKRIDESGLLSSIRQGDKSRFTKMVQEYYPVLCAYGRQFVDLEDAEEVVQDSMLWIWNNCEVLTIETSFSAYLFKMIYHRAMKRIEHNQAVRRADTRYYDEIQEMSYAIDMYQLKDLSRQIEKAIAELPESYREAFVMHRFKHLSYKQIAELLAVSPKTVDYRIQQALKLLRVSLKEYLPVLAPFLF